MKKIIFRFFINLLWLILFIPNLQGFSDQYPKFDLHGENKTKPYCDGDFSGEDHGRNFRFPPSRGEESCRNFYLDKILEKAEKLILILREGSIELPLDKKRWIPDATPFTYNSGVIASQPTYREVFEEIKRLERVYKRYKDYSLNRANKEWIHEPLEYYIELIFRVLPDNLQKRYLNSIFPKQEPIKNPSNYNETSIIIAGLVGALIVFLFALSKRNERIRLNIELEKEKRRREDLLKEKERKERNIRIKLEKMIPEKVSSLKSKSASILKKLRQSFYEVTKNVTEEEKDLLDLKNRHPKIESIVTSRKIGDSHSDQIKNIHEILGKLELE